jgi:glutamate carboxypeptidase
MTPEKLFNTIDALIPHYLDVWVDILNIESPSHSKCGVDAVGARLIQEAKELGFSVEVYSQPVSGDVVTLTLNPEAKSRPFTFSGHMDTVFPLGTLGAYPVRREGERLYGGGAADCKGGITAALLAMHALRDCGFRSRPVRLVLQSDEEVGSRPSHRATIDHICSAAKDSVAFLNVECASAGKACISRKGIVSYTFTVKGKAAHSARCATEGASAVLEAAHKIIELEKLKNQDGITCSCNLIEGGTALNTVPERCIFKANVRYATKEQLRWVDSYMQAVAERVYTRDCTTELSRSRGRVAMEKTEKNEALLTEMNRIFVSLGLSVLDAEAQTGGSDAAEVTAFGIPCVDSMGVLGERIHSPEEHALIPSLAEAAKRLAAVACFIKD